MKLTLLLLIMLLPYWVLAQDIHGTVMDKITGKPVPNATVSSSRSLTFTYADGVFNIKNIYPGDSVTIRCIGYKPYKMGIDVTMPKTITVYLLRENILLQSVVIKTRHDPKSDSIRLRKQFADVFNYKGPRFKNMFITVDPYKYVPYNYIDAPNSTASIVSINLLSVISLLNKNKDNTTKLQKTLLKDEETAYVDRAFSKQKITSLTNLKGDSLLDFMDDYRPTIKQVKAMNSYDMVIYIRNSYTAFVKNYNANEHSPFAR